MGLKATIQDFQTKLATIQQATPDGVTTDLFNRMWNNQIEQLRAGAIEAIPVPCTFLEPILTQSQHAAIGQGVCAFDILFRVHILHSHYNTEGSFEQNMLVFDLRDKIVRTLNRFKPVMCSQLDKVSEGLDFDHDNIYHYIIDFNCHFVDLTGSDQDDETGQYTVSVPPLALIINPDGPSYFDVNSYIDTDQGADCLSGSTQFNALVTFNKLMFFANGGTIVLNITASGTIIETSATGDGFTYDDLTRTVTITDIKVFTSVRLIVLVENPSCISVVTSSIQVSSYTGLINQGVEGTQQTFNQTYNPPL
jgi:hypothetical protein